MVLLCIGEDNILCYFPLPNLNISGPAYEKGVTSFPCGSCPECLAQRASRWALRAVFEASEHSENCMITLTYDNYARDVQGRVIGELPVNRDLKVCKRDAQLFLKRLRKYVYKNTGRLIKYILCAEYGKRTHRAHYHAIIFGYKFPDAQAYKRSKRGNYIYRSAILTKIWNHGICTVDSVNINGAVARYCTKYTAKDTRCDDTFMLFSRGIGEVRMMREFNGLGYLCEGREYPIPRQIWQRYISSAYMGYPMDYRYVGRSKGREAFLQSRELRAAYRKVRDSDPLYQSYLFHWQEIGRLYDRLKVSVRSRILQLDDSRYHGYKIAALRCLSLREKNPEGSYPAPRSGCVSRYYRYMNRLSMYQKGLNALMRREKVRDAKTMPFEEIIHLNDSFAHGSRRPPQRCAPVNTRVSVSVCYQNDYVQESFALQPLSLKGK